MPPQPPTDDFRDHLASVKQDGQRQWVFPKKPRGRFTRYRDGVAYGLLALLVAGPLIKINGQPLLMINILERKFVVFGQIFWPQDMYIFVLILLAAVVFIALFTVVYGRLFCGWVCPQTIFMENVFRKIEYWIEGDYTKQRALAKAPWNREKIVKRGGKYLIFYAISVGIAHVFLAYLIGADELFKIMREPVRDHVAGIGVLLLFSGAFFTVFTYLREQVCLVACPYGRLQGVLVDPDTLVIAYDHPRGEPRGKLRKGQTRTEGDCIDCLQCVHVCPTGIDIRNGTQLECINCTACIDACDEIMDRIGKPRGLVRYASQRSIEATPGQPVQKVQVRTVAYTAVLAGLLGLISYLVFTRSLVDAQLMRAQGQIYQVLPSGYISNLYNLKVINKAAAGLPVQLRVIAPATGGRITVVGGPLTVPAEGLADQVIIVELPPSTIPGPRSEIKLGVYGQLNGQEQLLKTVKSTFLAPAAP
jgi:cytochrome c oxidase accessory protein FixG